MAAAVGRWCVAVPALLRVPGEWRLFCDCQHMPTDVARAHDIMVRIAAAPCRVCGNPTPAAVPETP